MQPGELQTFFKQLILEPSALKASPQAQGMFSAGPGAGLENRLKVYRNNITASLTAAVMSALPMTKKLVGEVFLKRALAAYIKDNLPKQGNLNLYGESFSDFLAAYGPAQGYDYLPDFAQLEWLWERASYAKDDAAFDPARLTALSESQQAGLRFTFRDSFALLKSDHPLDEIVDICRKPGESADDPLKLSARGCYMMIFRPELKVEMRRLEAPEYICLDALQNGQSVHEMAEILLEAYPSADLGQLLKKHFELGTFSDFGTSPN